MQKVSRPATSFRPRGMLAAILAFAEAMRAQSGALQRRTRKMPGWEPGRSDDKGRHPGAFGAQGPEGLRRFAFPAGYGEACKRRYYERCVRQARAHAAKRAEAAT